MTLRGTELATYQFAHYNETILGNESRIFAPDHVAETADPQIKRQFEERFPVIYYAKTADGRFDVLKLEESAAKEGLDAMYYHDVYKNTDWTLRNCKNLVHATFPWCQARGEIFAATSEYLGRHLGVPHVPLIIDLPDTASHLRKELKIPDDALVFGRYGGSSTFSLPFVHDAIYKTLEKRRNTYFLFMNTDRFGQDHPQIIHLPGSNDLEHKVKFINTCDAMLHARKDGETFGLAVGEFSSKNKPVITWAYGDDNAHLEHLGKHAIIYRDAYDIQSLLLHFKPQPGQVWDVFTERFSPEKVMSQFKTVFQI